MTISSSAISYSNSIINAENTQSLKEALAVVKKGDIVFIDVDYVLIAPCDPVLRPCGEFLVNEWVLENDLDNDKERYHRLISIVMKNRKAEVVNREIVSVVNSLLGRIGDVYPLTAIATGRFGLIPCIEDWRIEDVSSFGYMFKEFSKYKPQLCIHSDAHDCIYKDGFILTGSLSKGEAVERFLDSSTIKVKRVIHIDDSMKHLKSVSNICEGRNINFLGIHFTELIVKNEKIDLCISRAQLNYLYENEEWVGENCMKTKLKEQNMTMNVTGNEVAMNLTNMEISIMNLTRVTPVDECWSEFLKMSCQYISNLWPDVLENKSIAEFEGEYESELKARIDQGGRGLFLFEFDKKHVGLSNAYVDQGTLNIAEFYIDSNYRRRGLGKEMYNRVLEWGKENNATKLAIEVDKDLDGANRFWSSFPGHVLDDSGDRNIYRMSLI